MIKWSAVQGFIEILEYRVRSIGTKIFPPHQHIYLGDGTYEFLVVQVINHIHKSVDLEVW
jgi:hypothetical protein